MTDPGATDALDAMLMRASRCDVQQHVLGGLLHDLNGPLNNVALTLALVAGSVARSAAAAPGDASTTRLARHVATLEAEVRRLAECSQAMSRTLQDEPGGAVAEPIVLAALLTEVRRRLRHHAALHDIVLEDVVEADGGTVVHAAREALQLALSALLLGACAACAPDARMRLATARRGVHAVVTIDARPAMLATDVRAALDAMVVPPPPAVLHLAAGRHAVRAQGGTVSFHPGENDLVIEVALPVR